MKCRTCDTSNPKRANQCIKCGTIFKRKHSFNLVLTLTVALAVCLILIILLIFAVLFKESNSFDDSDILPPVITEPVLQMDASVTEDKTMVQAMEYLEKYGKISVIGKDANSSLISFTYKKKEFEVRFYNDSCYISYDIGEGFQKYFLDVPVKNENDNILIEQEKFDAFLRDYIGVDPSNNKN